MVPLAEELSSGLVSSLSRPMRLSSTQPLLKFVRGIRSLRQPDVVGFDVLVALGAFACDSDLISS